MSNDPSPVPGVIRLPVADRSGHPFDVVMVERRTVGGTWELTGVGLRHRGTAWWLPGFETTGSFEYWWEKDSNGYTLAVFHYVAVSEEAAARLAQARRDELAAGAAPLPPLTTAWPPGAPVPDLLGTGSTGTDAEVLVVLEDGGVQPWPHLVASALVWRLAATLAARHPGRLWVQTQGGGMYDRVAVRDLADPVQASVVVFNAAGTHALLRSGPVVPWVDAFADGADPVGWLRHVEDTAALPGPGPLPAPVSPRSLAAAVVAGFLAAHLGSGADWVPRPADAWAPDGWNRDLVAELRRAHPHGVLEVVFVGRAGERDPGFAVTGAGVLVRADGTRVDLLDRYRPGGPVLGLLAGAVPDLLP